MPTSSTFAPDFRAMPYWWEQGDPSRTPASSELDNEDFDVVIVGGGVTGLACALHLASKNVSVLVIERHGIGWGASSRNAGGVSGGVNLGHGPTSNISAISQKQISEMRSEAVASYGFLQELIAKEDIGCDYRHNGRVLCAHSPAAFNSLQRRAAELNALGEREVELLPREAMREEVGSDAFYGGMIVNRSGVLHPAKFVQGLAAAASRRGARLLSNTEVATFDRAPGSSRYVLQTSRGRISANQIVIATNGYTSQMTSWHRRRLIPIGSFIVATETLDPALVSSCFPKNRFYADTRRLLHYFRPSPDGRRVIFGGRADFVSSETRAYSILHRNMTRLFPQLEGVKISYGWTGNVAFSFDGLPHVGVHDGVHYALGCNGSGVTMLSYLGHRIATYITGSEEQRTAFATLPFGTVPFYNGRPWFLPIVGSWFKFRDKVDLGLARLQR